MRDAIVGAHTVLLSKRVHFPIYALITVTRTCLLLHINSNQQMEIHDATYYILRFSPLASIDITKTVEKECLALFNIQSTGITVDTDITRSIVAVGGYIRNGQKYVHTAATICVSHKKQYSAIKFI